MAHREAQIHVIPAQNPSQGPCWPLMGAVCSHPAVPEHFHRALQNSAVAIWGTAGESFSTGTSMLQLNFCFLKPANPSPATSSWLEGHCLMFSNSYDLILFLQCYKEERSGFED